ncbi:GNAT family N-acetyltransferase [Marinifilum flexuosum]|uniref:GNAT family N-acetyltransferase n=1 Tax=Marinifilum flexuosum TaxID=1117708 RepID=UPI002494B4B7|nr:GNAT family N-acetyltransferase [Marinifilum flexuosum]
MINARRNDIPLLIKILTPPFSANLSVNRCVKQDDKRLQRIENQIRYISKISIRNNFAFVNTTKTGVVLCNLSNGKKANILDDLYFIFKVSGLKLGLQLLKREKMLKQLHPKSDYCHLWFIGVKNSSQGSGIGTKMIKFLKQTCQEKGLPIYLETSNPDNLKFYEKNGFKLYKTVKLPMDDFELYLYSWVPQK